MSLVTGEMEAVDDSGESGTDEHGDDESEGDDADMGE